MKIKKQTVTSDVPYQPLCPVCQTAYQKTISNCAICAWHFPQKDSTDYPLMLAKAKQQYHIVTTIAEVAQALKSQQQTLQQMATQIAQLNQTVLDLKNNSGIVQLHRMGPSKTNTVSSLMPVPKAENFDTLEKRQAWWETLEEQWQKAFNEGFLGKEAIAEPPNDADLQSIFESPSLRFVGPQGMYPNLSFELTNLSGLKHLTTLTTLVVTNHAIRNLEGIEHLSKLACLFAQNNQLTTIDAIQHLPQLEQLYCQSNALTSIAVVEGLTQLNTLHCNHNPLEDFRGITAEHAEKLKGFYALPNDKIRPREIRRVEDLGIFCRKG